MKKELLKYLCCPTCKGDFQLAISQRRGKEIIDGQLICSRCNQQYLIDEGVPVILERKMLHDYSKTRKNWEQFYEETKRKSSREGKV